MFHLSAYQPLVNVLLNDSADTVREYVTGASAEDKRYIVETLMGILEVRFDREYTPQNEELGQLIVGIHS